MPGNLDFTSILERLQDPPTKDALRFTLDQIAFLKQQVKGPIIGTLQPDTRPRLTAQQRDVKFFATDFNRTFQWTGSAWTDAPDAPPRFLIAFFNRTPEPSVGWVKCDGRQATRSTSTGQTQAFNAPVVADYSGQAAHIRV